jgi:integrase
VKAREGTTGPLLTGPDGGPLQYDAIRHTFKTKVISALSSRFPSDKPVRFEHAVLHSFRHHFVSESFRRGIDEGTIRDWIGHRDSKIIERYRHLAKSDSWAKMQTLGPLGPECVPDVPAGTVRPQKGRTHYQGGESPTASLA